MKVRLLQFMVQALHQCFIYQYSNSNTPHIHNVPGFSPGNIYNTQLVLVSIQCGVKNAEIL